MERTEIYQNSKGHPAITSSSRYYSERRSRSPSNRKRSFTKSTSLSSKLSGSGGFGDSHVDHSFRSKASQNTYPTIEMTQSSGCYDDEYSMDSGAEEGNSGAIGDLTAGEAELLEILMASAGNLPPMSKHSLDGSQHDNKEVSTQNHPSTNHFFSSSVTPAPVLSLASSIHGAEQPVRSCDFVDVLPNQSNQCSESSSRPHDQQHVEWTMNENKARYETFSTGVAERNTRRRARSHEPPKHEKGSASGSASSKTKQPGSDSDTFLQKHRAFSLIPDRQLTHSTTLLSSSHSSLGLTAVRSAMSKLNHNSYSPKTIKKKPPKKDPAIAEWTALALRDLPTRDPSVNNYSHSNCSSFDETLSRSQARHQESREGTRQLEERSLARTSLKFKQMRPDELSVPGRPMVRRKIKVGERRAPSDHWATSPRAPSPKKRAKERLRSPGCDVQHRSRSPDSPESLRSRSPTRRIILGDEWPTHPSSKAPRSPRTPSRSLSSPRSFSKKSHKQLHRTRSLSPSATTLVSNSYSSPKKKLPAVDHHEQRSSTGFVPSPAQTPRPRVTDAIRAKQESVGELILRPSTPRKSPSPKKSRSHHHRPNYRYDQFECGRQRNSSPMNRKRTIVQGRRGSTGHISYVNTGTYSPIHTGSSVASSCASPRPQLWQHSRRASTGQCSQSHSSPTKKSTRVVVNEWMGKALRTVFSRSPAKSPRTYRQAEVFNQNMALSGVDMCPKTPRQRSTSPRSPRTPCRGSLPRSFEAPPTPPFLPVGSSARPAKTETQLMNDDIGFVMFDGNIDIVAEQRGGMLRHGFVPRGSARTGTAAHDIQAKRLAERRPSTPLTATPKKDACDKMQPDAMSVGGASTRTGGGSSFGAFFHRPLKCL